MIRVHRATVDSIRVVAGGILVCIAVMGYFVTHVFFLGMPVLNPATVRGRLELAYTLADLAIAGFGAYSIYCGFKNHIRAR